MKKAIAILLVICAAAFLLPAAAEEPSPVGTWYANRVFRPQMNTTLILSDEASYSGTLTIKEDGTFLLSETEDGETHDQNGAWKLTGDGTLRLELPGTGMETTFPAPFISISGSDSNIMFSRSEPGPLTAPVLEITEEYAHFFNGTWAAEYALTKGMKTDLATIGIDSARFDIQDGAVTVAVALGGLEPVSMTFSCSVQDGALFLNMTDSDGNFISQIRIDFHEDGTITVPDLVPAVAFLCEKQAEQ